MMTMRSLGAISLLLAGSTWLWLTPAFAGRGISTSGLLWDVTRALCLLTMASFCVATWALFTRQAWWEAAALGSAVLGLVTLIPYWFAAYNGGTTAGTVTWNAFVHVLMVVGVFALLLVPELEHWVNHHVMRG
jgi:hypothetical protein